MTAIELKSNIIDDIKELKDENVLNILKAVLDTYKNEPLVISEKSMKILEEAKKQIRDKNYIADEVLKEEELSFLKRL